MNRRGKIFTLGLMILYLLSATTALVLLSGGLSRMPEETIGSYQVGLLAAQERGEQKLLYIETAGKNALTNSIKQLYEDQRAFFLSRQGDAEEGLGCGAYTYQLWNNKMSWCIGDLDTLTEAMKPVVMREVAAAAMTFPYGPFTVSYQLNLALDDGLLASFYGEPITEPILLGLKAGEQSEDVTTATEQLDVGNGLIWPSNADTLITSCFGPRNYEHASSDVHHGVDIGPNGLAIAARAGKVINNPSTSTVGAVWIQHSPTFSTRYLHLTDIKVRLGQTVEAGQRLGTPSNLGCGGCGKHLHFEVLVKELPRASSHAYRSIMGGGWRSVNPLCFFSEETLRDKTIWAGSTQSCLRADYPKPPKTAYCEEYGIKELDEVNAYTQGTATGERDEEGNLITTEEPAGGDTTTRPTTLGEEGLLPDSFDFELTQDQQSQFHTTLENQHKYGWTTIVDGAAADTGVDAALIRGVITQESRGEPLIISPTGCAGIMQWCIDSSDKSRSTAARFFGSGAYLTFCECGSTFAGQGSSCKCTAGNDRRLAPEYAIPAGAKLLDALLDKFATKTHRVAFAVASYNVGEAAVFNAIRGTGDTDPSWEQVATYMKSHPDVIPYDIGGGKAAKIDQVFKYVPAVLAYSQAWNGGTALDEGFTARELGDIQQVGTYEHPANFAVEMEDTLSPFLDLVSWSKEAIARCENTPVPYTCLLDTAATNDITHACEEPVTQYFVDLYEAIRDCGDNLQSNCKCALPTPPMLAENANYTFSIDTSHNMALLRKDGEPLQRLHFEQLSNKTIRVGTGEGVNPGELSITAFKDEDTDTFTFRYKERSSVENPAEPVVWQPGWSLEKGEQDLKRVIFRESATADLGVCAPVKIRESFCKEVLPGWPAVRFALTIEDAALPATVAGPSFDGRFVTFDASTSEDTAFYNIYRGDRLVLQTRETRFDASPWIGSTLTITTVDLAGNEGSGATIALTPPAS